MFLKQLFKFLMTSALSAILTLGMPIFLHEIAAVAENRAVLIAFVVAYFFNFFVLKYIVFEGKGKARYDLFKYLAANLAFRAAEYFTYIYLNSVLDYNYVICLLIVLIAFTIIKFFSYRWLFNRPVRVATG